MRRRFFSLSLIVFISLQPFLIWDYKLHSQSSSFPFTKESLQVPLEIKPVLISGFIYAIDIDEVYENSLVAAARTHQCILENRLYDVFLPDLLPLYLLTMHIVAEIMP